MAPAADCHAHVFGPGYAFAPDIPYEPHATQRGTAAQFLAVLDAHGLTHGLLVAAQPYLLRQWVPVGRDRRIGRTPQ